MTQIPAIAVVLILALMLITIACLIHANDKRSKLVDKAIEDLTHYRQRIASLSESNYILETENADLKTKVADQERLFEASRKTALCIQTKLMEREQQLANAEHEIELLSSNQPTLMNLYIAGKNINRALVAATRTREAFTALKNDPDLKDFFSIVKETTEDDNGKLSTKSVATSEDFPYDSIVPIKGIKVTSDKCQVLSTITL